LFRKLLSEANYILKAGTTQNKIALMRSVIPALMKELQAREESARDSETREMLKDLFAAARLEIKEKPGEES
jgi:fructoselysine-6-P-deglycase FrlB-like protein